MAFAYDGLNRLTYASTTQASSTPYLHTFSYSSLGNITAMSTSTATTTYIYAGTGYANPHAATGIGSYSLSYDNNGNLTSYGSVSYTWDYRNRLMNTGAGTATSTYGYDYQNNRVAQYAGGITTIYVNKLYSTNTASTTKHIFAGNDLIAVVERAGSATTTHIIHTDHLGGTNAITDADGDIVQALDYYPYGGLRIDTRAGSFDERRKFTGHEYDTATGLNYMMARYQDPSRGQFLSEDPASRDNPRQFLADPQQMNSYSYARGNPVKFIDSNGKSVLEFSGGIHAGPFSAGGGVRVDPHMGWQVFGSFPSVGLGVGASLKYDPAGKLEEQHTFGTPAKVQAELTVVPIVGKSWSVEAEENPSNPLSFAKHQERSSAWAFGLELGASFSWIYNSKPFLFGNNSQIENQSSGLIPHASNASSWSGYSSLNETQRAQLVDQKYQNSYQPNTVAQNGIIYVRVPGGGLKFADSERTK